MAWIFVPAERVKAMTAEEVIVALQSVITARRRAINVMRASGPLMAVVSIAAIGPSMWLVPALMGSILLGGLLSNWMWHLYRSACVLGACGYARDALVGRMVTADNLGFGPNR
jgi:hypothetical protein